MNLWHGLKWILFPCKSRNWLSNKITPKLTWNLLQAQTEPKLHSETANMEFEQVVTKRSAILKGDSKLEPKWFLRRGSCKFHVSDFRATLFFTSYCARGIMIWTWVEPSQYHLNIAPSKLCGSHMKVFSVSANWMADDSGNSMAFPELLVEH